MLLGLSKPQDISSRLRTEVDEGAVVISVLSYREVLLKSMKGKLAIDEPRVWWADALDKFAATALPLRPEHVSAIRDLPPIHPDPFDRALMAQAMVEDLTLVTLDGAIAKYASDRLRVLA